ncbi:MAG: Cna B-type domain-containing protein [Erysipelotrichia bacterium]|nr:Cna B-type domain-containing protein [Erysipelotrichia bacterium]
MKKLLSIMLIFSMVCSFFTTNVSAAGNPTITDTIVQNGHLTVTGGTAPYTWEKRINKEKYTAVEYTVYDIAGANMAGDGSWINVALTGGGLTESTTVTYRVTDADGKQATFTQKKYSSKLLNGSFENPSTKKGNYIQSSISTSNLYWNTTADEKRIEIAYANSNNYFFGVSQAADGDQFAELNCEEEGSLYQDVLTVPGTTLNWSFYHRARLQTWGGGDTAIQYFNGIDTMALVIVSAETMSAIETQQDIIDVVNNPTAYNAFVLKHSAGNEWSAVSGNYVVPAGQYLTRFFFVSVSAASGDKTIGNLIDKVQFNDVVNPLPNTASLQIRKVATSDEENLQYPNPTIYIYDTDANGGKANLRWTVNPVANGENVTVSNVSAGTYYIEEANADIDGYALTTAYQVGNETIGNTFTITQNQINNSAIDIIVNNHYTFINPKINIPVTKSWDDNSNNDGLRPENVTIKLLADGVDTGKILLLSEENNWAGSFSDLDKYNSEKNEIVYTVEEVNVEEYSAVVSGNQNDGYTVTNTHEPKTTEVRGTKTWDDDNNRDGMRPSSITVKLLANGQEYRQLTVTAENNWAYVFDNLPKYVDKQEVVYTIEENNVENYKTTVNGYDLINTHEIETIVVSGTKTWVGDDNTNYRPENITVTLYADAVAVEQEATWQKEGNVWTYTFSNLPKYSNGQLINYTVAETDVQYYTKTQDGYNFTNTLNLRNEGYGEFAVKKINGGTGLPMGGVEFVLTNGQGNEVIQTTTTDGYAKFTDLAAGTYTLKEVTPTGYVDNDFTWTLEVSEDYTVKLEEKAEDNVIVRLWKWLIGVGPEASFYEFDATNNELVVKNYPLTSVTATKVWDDNDDQDGIRPDSLELVLYANGAKVENVQPQLTKEGSTWTYVWADLPEYENGEKIVYTVDEAELPQGYNKSLTDNRTIINTHAPETINIKGHKSWEDDENAYGKRPETITVNLLKNNEIIKTIEVGEQQNWSWEFSELPKYENGEEIIYSVTENPVEHYETSYQEYNIINTYIMEKIDISVIKHWNDNDDEATARPNEIVVYLVVNGEKTDTKIVINAENQWTGMFENLDKYIDREEAEYTIEEEQVENYETLIEGNQTDGFEITNTYVPKVVVPDTGDHSNINIWITIMSASVVAVVAFVVYGKKKKIW